MHTTTKASEVARYRVRCCQHQRDDDKRAGLQVCRSCGCTEHAACPGGCAWIEYDLCSRCLP